MRIRLEIEVVIPDGYAGRAGQFAQSLYDEYRTPGGLVADWLSDEQANGVLTVVGPTEGSRMMSWRKGRWTKPRRF